MSEPANNELERLIKLRPLPGDTQVVEADEAERAALAARFGLASVRDLRAEVKLTPDGNAVRADGSLAAEILQYCAISAEEFPVKISEPIAFVFVDAALSKAALADDTQALEIELSDDELDEIEYSGDMIDLGEAIAQSLGLAIDPYAEGPQADAARKAAGIAAEGEQDGPLADMLKGLVKD